MMKRMKWTRIGLGTLLAVSLLGAPQFAAAGERWHDQDSYSRANRDYRTGNDHGYTYPGSPVVDRNYRDSAYRDRGYGNNGYNQYRDSRYYDDYRSTRSAGESAAIIGGGAAAGAVVGGIAKGGKGALIGAAIGGIGGLIYDRVTKDKDHGRRW
jgi:hypothetical protein